jgi:beta-lactam-binding protein with PASTA domain
MRISTVRSRQLLATALTVCLFACSSGEEVVVPGFDEFTPVGEVEKELEDAGFVVEFAEVPCGASGGCTPGYLRSEPAAGTRVESGSTVEIAYYPTNLPNGLQSPMPD